MKKNSSPSVILELHEKFKDSNFISNFYNDLKSLQDYAQNNLKASLTALNLDDFFKDNQYQEDNLLWNIPYSLKDNVSTHGIKTTAGSLFLEDYIPSFDSEVYSNIKKNKAVLVSKDALDEFGLGGSGTWCAFGRVINPYDSNYITAGSSSGSAVTVAIGLAAFSIGTDTGGSVRQPASFLGIVGLKPSYGLISRYGIFPFSPTLDTVGIFAKYVTDIAIVLQNIVSTDKRDFSNIKYNNDRHNFYDELNKIDLEEFKQIKIAYIKEATYLMEDDLKDDWINYLNFLKQYANITEISLGNDIINLLLPIYKTISYSEATTMLARMTGMTFGKQIIKENYEDSCIATRTKYLGREIKNRLLFGAWVLSEENYDPLFNKSRKIRRFIKNKIDDIFKGFDTFIIPGAGNYTLSLEDLEKKEDSKCTDLLLLSNFTGIPSITILALDKKPKFCGLNINCNWYEDQKLLNIALTIEDINKNFDLNKKY